MGGRKGKLEKQNKTKKNKKQKRKEPTKNKHKQKKKNKNSQQKHKRKIGSVEQMKRLIKYGGEEFTDGEKYNKNETGLKKKKKL